MRCVVGERRGEAQGKPSVQLKIVERFPNASTLKESAKLDPMGGKLTSAG